MSTDLEHSFLQMPLLLLYHCHLRVLLNKDSRSRFLVEDSARRGSNKDSYKDSETTQVQLLTGDDMVDQHQGLNRGVFREFSGVVILDKSIKCNRRKKEAPRTGNAFSSQSAEKSLVFSLQQLLLRISR